MGGDLSEVVTWSRSIGITDLAVYGYLSESSIDTVQATGLNIWYINTFGASNNLQNWTSYTTSVLSTLTTFGYDGVIFDDTQALWYSAHQNGTTDDLVYYQQFCDNITTNLVPTMGSDQVIVEMAAWGDSTDFNDMKSVDITDFIFSYYYEPDPRLIYYNIQPPTWTNMTVNAWDIKTHYDNWGLNTYYKYQGWLWLENYWSEPSTSTLSIVKSYNSIVDLYGNYTVNDLMIYNVEQLLYTNRLKNEALLMDIIDAWTTATKLAESKLVLQDFKTYYWQDTFASPPFNQSTLNSENWQTYTDAEGNYSMTTTYTGNINYLSIAYNGTNDSGSYQYQTIERRIECSEQALSIPISFIPINSTSDKFFILKGIYPHPYAYSLKFEYGADKRILFSFINGTSNLASDVYADMNWTVNSNFLVTYTLNETNVSVSVNNSTDTWTYSVPIDQIKYNSNRIYSLYIVDRIGDYNQDQLELISMKINYVYINPLRNYVEVTQWAEGQKEGTITTQTDLELYYAEYGLPYDLSVYSSTNEREINFTHVGDYSIKFNMTYYNEDFIIRAGYAFWIPLEFMMGMFGLVGMIGFPMIMINKAKKKEFSDMGFMFAGACLSAALFFAWLWMA